MPNTEAPMTPIRETIARAVERYMRLPEEADEIWDEVLRALDEAGCVVVPREPTFDMKKAGVEAMGEADRGARAQASSWPDNDFQRGAVVGATLACNSVNLVAAYRAMISASVVE